MAIYESPVVYRYFLTNLLTNEIISEVPFKGVSFERMNRRAGKFDGQIAFIPETKGLNLYESTMPGRTGLYITRNSQVVWGGIIWSRSYDVKTKVLSVSGAEFISYFYHRQIWQTLVYGSEFIGLTDYQVSGGVGIVNTEINHGFSVGDKVAITFANPAIDGVHTITATDNAKQFRFSSAAANIPVTQINSAAVRSLVDTYDFARDIVNQVGSDLAGLGFANEAIKPAKELQGSVISAERSGGVVTLKTSFPHSAIPGQEIEVIEVGNGMDGLQIIEEVPDQFTIVYRQDGPNVSRYTLSGIRYLNVARKSFTPSTTLTQENNGEPTGVITFTTDVAHGASVGQTVFVEGVDGFFTGRVDSVFNGRFAVVSGSGTTITVHGGGILPVADEPSYGGTLTLGSKFVYGEYGSFVNNSYIGIEFDDEEILSGKYQDQQVLRGYENKTAGEILEQYSTNINGFEYRIDCDYDFNTASFTRTFKLLDSTPAITPEEGSIYSVTDLGAQFTVFEYPGNISTFVVDETAEEAATRFFTQGNIPDLTDDSSKPYAAASARDMLYTGKPSNDWPLLDQLEVLNDISDEATLYEYAADYLYEGLPPIGDYKLTVNGSIDPVVGSYNPGDWCSIIIDDEFVRARLVTDQEPRDDIIIRKIMSYKVSVPDTPTQPEVVDLTLMADWKVDQNGN